MTQTIAVFGDVHGNGRALKAALTQAKTRGCDRMVFVGDLLTYGHDVTEVIDLVAEAQTKHGAELIIGNHDRMYFDLAAGNRAYYETLPAWLQASIDLTLEDPRTTSLADLKWSSAVQLDDRAVAGHGNPFGAEDWRYLNSDQDHIDAATALAGRGMDVGVYGHTHRPRWYRERLVVPEFDVSLRGTRTTPIVINAGAIGQPRDKSGRAILLRLILSSEVAEATFETVAYDSRAHIAALSELPLPATTIAQLCRFFAT